MRAVCRICLPVVLWAATIAAGPSIDPVRSWHELVSANGYGGVVVSLDSARVHHLREHIYATEEPRWQADGEELWLPTEPGGDCYQPQVVFSRDLLQDAYFGVAAAGTSRWLTEAPVDLDASGYDGLVDRDGRDGGTGIARMVQPLDDVSLVATTRAFVPWETDWTTVAVLLEVANTGDAASGPVTLYGLVNTNLGAGRPGPQSEIGSRFETITIQDDDSVVEQGFAGVVYVAPLDRPSRVTHSPTAFYATVRDGLGDLPLPDATGVLADGAASAYQWDIADIPAGESAWVGVVVAHDPNPDFVGRKALTDVWIDGRGAAELHADERGVWRGLQADVRVPAGLTDAEVDLYYHSAAILRMAQVRESSYWVRPEIDEGVARWTGIDGEVEAVIGGMIREHQGAGAVLARLPPGRWAYAWVRDGAYAIVGLTDGGLFDEARAALSFFLEAHANRYVDFEELSHVPLRDYALSLTRYHGFGIEESDTPCNGDLNFEWDGFGLFLWALRHYVAETGDTSLVEEHWTTIRDGIAGVIEGLVEEGTGLLWPDSSIWEVHWFGDEKHFAYTNIAAARGLCDAAWLAGETEHTVEAAAWDVSGRRLRQAIHEHLSGPEGAIVANTEEYAAGAGYWDAAVIEAVAMGLFDPIGPTATATLAAIRDNLTVPSGCGIFRNDDEFDAHDLSPYGGPYDSLEWVFLDYRTSIAARHAGETEYADGLQDWVRDQSLQNYLLIGENYDGSTGEYRNNAPMIGFGSGSYITAMRQRSGDWSVDPACGVYFEDDESFGPGGVGEDTGIPDVGPDVDGGTADPAPDASDDAAADPEPDAAPDAADGSEAGVDSSPDGGDDDATSDTSDDGASDGSGAAARPDVDRSDADSGRARRISGGKRRRCGVASDLGTPPWLALVALVPIARRRRGAPA